jgi:hypothetical protein
VPFAPNLERAYLPMPSKIEAAVKRLMAWKK